MAKRKRINVQFIVIVAIVLVVVAAAGAFLMKTVFKPNPQKYLALAQADMQRQDWEQATKDIGTAIRYSKTPDPGPWIMLADASLRLMAKDPAEYGTKWRIAMDQALQIDPTNKEALRRRLDFYLDAVRINGERQAAVYDAITKLAQRLLAVDPTNSRAQYAQTFATLDQWFTGMQIDPKSVDDAEAKLVQLLKDDPNNDDIPRLMVGAKIYRAKEQARLLNRKGARQLITEIDALINDLLAKYPDKAITHNQMGVALFEVGELYPATVERPTTEPVSAVIFDTSKLPPEVKAAVQKRYEYFTRGYAELEKAVQLAKPSDEDYVDIATEFAARLERPAAKMKPDITLAEANALIQEASKQAEQVYREVIKNAPGDQRPRVLLGKFIGRVPARREEAIAILSEPVPPNPKWIGVRSKWIKLTEAETYNALADLRLSLAESKAEPEQRKALVEQAQADYDKLVSIRGDSSPQALTLKGRTQLLKNDPVGAAQTFDRALSLYSRALQDRYELYELQFYLARTYLLTQQTGEAKKLFRQILAMNPNHVGARLQLAELLINEGNIRGTPPRFEDGALTQLDAAAPLLQPDDPNLVALRLKAADRAKDDKQFTAMWAKMPENTADERFNKARMAAGIGKTDEAIRLLELVRKEKPGALDVADPLARLYLSKNDKPGRDKAIEILKEAAAKNPDNKGIPTAIKQLENPASVLEDQLKQIQGVKDPFKRNMMLAQFYAQTGEPDKGFAALQEAEKIEPENDRVQAAMFDQYLRRKDFDKAGGYIEKLSKKNVDNAEGQIFRIRYALAQGKTEEAYSQAQKLVEIRKEFAQAHVLLGQTLQALRRYEEAINAYQQAIDRQTGNMDAIKGLVESYLALGRPGKPSNDATGQKATDARFYMEMGARLNPNDVYYKDNLLRWEIVYGDPQKAVESRAQAVKDRPDSPQAWLELGMVYLTAAQPKRTEGADPKNQAIAQPPPDLSDAKAKEFLTKARDTFAQALQKWPEEPRFMQTLVDTHLQLKEIDQAEKVLTAFIAQPKFKDLPDSTEALADFYERSNQPAKGEKVLRDALAKQPENVKFQIRLASQLRGQNKFDEALKVLEMNPDQPSVARYRVETLTRAGRLDDASKYIDSRLAKDPGNDFYQRLRANIDLALGKIDSVRAASKRILDANPNDLDGLYLRARANLVDPNGDVNAAISDLIRVVSLQPGSVDARLQLAQAQWKRGVYEDAIRTMDEAVQKVPNDKQLRLTLLNYYINARPPRWFDAESFLKQTRAIPQFANDVDLIHVEAQMWLARKDPAKALNLIRDAMKQNPDNLAFLHTYFSILSDNKDYNTLITEADKQIKAKPELWWAYQFRGIAKIARNDKAGGVADLKAALNGALKANDKVAAESVARVIADKAGIAAARDVLAPLAENDPHWQLVLANMLYTMAGDTSSAISLTEKALSVANLDPAELEVGLKLAGILYMSSQPPNVPKAIECYRKLVKEQPNDTNVLNNLAYLLLEPGPTYNPTEAVQYSRRVLDLTIAQDDRASLPLVQDTHAWALINSGRPDEGIALLREALSKKKFLDGFYHLGEGYMRKQPPDQVEAERALLDGQDFIKDQTRAQQPIDANMKAKIQASLDRVRSMRK